MPNRPYRRSSAFIPHPSSLILLFLSLFLLLSLLTPWVNAKEAKPKPQEWQIRGIEAALEDERPGVKNAALVELDEYETGALQALIKQDTVRAIANQLKDNQQDPRFRGKAAEVLSSLGRESVPYIPEILKFIKDDKQDPDIRGDVTWALGNLGKDAATYVPDVIKIIEDDKHALLFVLVQLRH